MSKTLIIKLLLLVTLGAGLGVLMQKSMPSGKAPEVVLRPSGWSLLGANEQKILQPLADKWETMGSTQQAKWRAIAKKYPSLSLREQQKMQRRMTRWVEAKPEQRAVARKKFKKYKQKKPAEQERVRSAWQNHQAAKAQDNPAPLPLPSDSPGSVPAAAPVVEGDSNMPSVVSGSPAESVIGESAK